MYDEATKEAIGTNAANRAKFKAEWARLDMPGDVIDTTVNKLPVCGRFAETMQTTGHRLDFDMAEALRVFRDFGDGDGNNVQRRRNMMRRLHAEGAVDVDDPCWFD